MKMIKFHKCIEHAGWYKDAMVCNKCGTVLAMRFIYDGVVEVYAFNGFKKHEQAIQDREDTSVIADERACLEEIHFDEFGDLLDDIKSRQELLLSLPSDGEWISEDWQGDA